MEDDYGSNVHVGLKKSVRFMERPLFERFCYKGFLRNSSGTKFLVRLREVSALKDVRFREVPLYIYIENVIFPCMFWKISSFIFHPKKKYHIFRKKYHLIPARFFLERPSFQNIWKIKIWFSVQWGVVL